MHYCRGLSELKTTWYTKISMPKPSKPKPDQSQKTDIEARIDAMMDINSDGITDPKPIDIFAGQKAPVDETPGAPPVPGVRPHKSDTKVVDKPVAVAPTPVKEPEVDDVKVTDMHLDTPQTDEAIDDIVAQEADTVLAAQDAGIEQAVLAADSVESEPTQKSGGHPIFWFFIVLLVIVAAATAYVLTSPGLDLPFDL